MEFLAFPDTGGGPGSDIGPGCDQIATLFVDDGVPACSLESVTQLRLDQAVVADDNRKQFTPETVSGSIFCGCDGPVLCGCKGDLDQNKQTDIFDVLRCVDSVLQLRTPSDTERALIDLNCDGTVNVVDCLAIVDVILKRLPPCPACPACS